VKLLLGPHRYRRHIVCGLNDNVRVWARKQKCLEALSEDREWRRSCDVSRQVVPYRSARNCECATADCRSTMIGKFRRSEPEERSRRRDGISATRVKQDWRYFGPAPWMARYVKTANLKEIRSEIRSQWRLMSARDMCSERRKPNMKSMEWIIKSFWQH